MLVLRITNATRRLPVRFPSHARAMPLVYDEDAFLYVLSVERQRAARSLQPVILMLAVLRDPPRVIEPAVAAELFAAVGGSVRESDVVGWFRHRRAVGTVLVGCPDAEVEAVGRRITLAVRHRLHAHVGRGLRLRYVRLRPRLGPWTRPT